MCTSLLESMAGPALLCGTDFVSASTSAWGSVAVFISVSFFGHSRPQMALTLPQRLPTRPKLLTVRHVLRVSCYQYYVHTGKQAGSQSLWPKEWLGAHLRRGINLTAATPMLSCCGRHRSHQDSGRQLSSRGCTTKGMNDNCIFTGHCNAAYRSQTKTL